MARQPSYRFPHSQWQIDSLKSILTKLDIHSDAGSIALHYVIFTYSMAIPSEQLEQRQLHRFLECMEISATGIIKSEPPDFYMQIHSKNSPPKKVSVELTTVVNGEIKKYEEAQQRVLELARQIFISQHPDKLDVFVDFTSEKLDLSPEKLSEVATELYEVVNQIHVANRNYRYHIEIPSWPVFNKYFDNITVTNKYADGFWQSTGAFIVQHVDLDQLQTLIHKKTRHIERYKEKCDENWLLIVGNFGYKSSTYQYQNIAEGFVDTGFHRIFIFKYRENEVIRLK